MADTKQIFKSHLLYYMRFINYWLIIIFIVFAIFTLYTLNILDKEAICSKSFKEKAYQELFNIHIYNESSNKPIIYLITATNTRITQKADLTRLINTLLHVKHLHWIVVEDRNRPSKLVTKFLASYSLPYTHLYVSTPYRYKLKLNDTRWRKPRGVLQRNLGLEWLRKNYNKSKAVVYFADDDNTYDLKLFEEFRYTKKISVWPVGLVGYLRYETPIVNNNKVTGWFTYWKPYRPFALDMAGFAVNLQLILKYPLAKFSMTVGRGEQESYFLASLKVTLDDLEPLASNCTEILVWHTQTVLPSLKNEDKLKNLNRTPSDLNIEV